MNNSKYPPSILLPVKRIIAIGDIHGDYKATISALQLSKLIDKSNNWIGGNTIVVQLGDQLDREVRNVGDNSDEDSEIKIMNLFKKLNKQAKKKNGAVYSLLGNHEIMNVLGDYTYTSKLGIKHFGNKKDRYKNFKPGSKFATEMAKNYNVIMKIGDWIFVHAGITVKISEKYNISEINDLMRKYLLGEENLSSSKKFKELFLNQNSLLWTRRYSEDKIECKTLSECLKNFDAKYIVIGHTPQDNINCKCKKSVWRIDTGMSRAFGKRDNMKHIQVLEILNYGKTINIL